MILHHLKMIVEHTNAILYRAKMIVERLSTTLHHLNSTLQYSNTILTQAARGARTIPGIALPVEMIFRTGMQVPLNDPTISGEGGKAQILLKISEIQLIKTYQEENPCL